MEMHRPGNMPPLPHHKLHTQTNDIPVHSYYKPTMKSTTYLVVLILTPLAELCRCNPYDDMRVEDLWFHFGCDEIFEEPRPIHSPSDWLGMRGEWIAPAERVRGGRETVAGGKI